MYQYSGELTLSCGTGFFCPSSFVINLRSELTFGYCSFKDLFTIHVISNGVPESYSNDMSPPGYVTIINIIRISWKEKSQNKIELTARSIEARTRIGYPAYGRYQ